MRRLYPLNNVQRDFSQENINLVYKFLNSRGLAENDYYDIVIFGYLSAVQEYEERPELKKYKFSTIAWKQMQQSLSENYVYQNRKKRNGRTVSLNQKDSVSLDEILPNNEKNIDRRMEDRLNIQQIIGHLTKKEREVVFLKARGFTYREIAQLCGITPDGVSSRFSRMRTRLTQLNTA